MKSSSTVRIYRTLDEILADVARVGTVRVDWAFLLRMHFRENSVAKFSEWAAAERLQWKLEEYDRGGFEKGHTVVLSTGAGKHQAVEEGLAAIASKRSSAKEVISRRPGRAPGRANPGSSLGTRKDSRADR